ncbi:MAG: VCBS repeat-containing protein, partial [Gammaproteobacteria bacterium]
MGSGAAVFDYDGDGDLDLYLVQGTMLGPDKTLGDATFPPAAAQMPLMGRLYRNDLSDGEIRFVDVTQVSGLRATGYGMGVATGDIDNDGDVDLYITNFGSNQLWVNNGDGTFSDRTVAAGV